MTELHRILVVCTGNVCRSPMAEGLLARLVRREGLHHVVVDSAGTHAPEGTPPSSSAVTAAAELGADITGIRATPLDRRSIDEADLILVMEPEHKLYILQAWPEESAGKVRLIRSFHTREPSEEAVPDPIGTPLPVYRRIAQVLLECCEGVVKVLKRGGVLQFLHSKK